MKRDTSRHAEFGIILTVVLLLAYQPAWHGTPILDDAGLLPKPADRSLSGVIKVWIHPSVDHQYHPLVDTIFWIETKLFKGRMAGYHLPNILLHAAAALLLFEILRKLSMAGAWLATGLFALHPVQVESVAYLAEMKNTLSGVCLFAALLAYMRYERKCDRRSYWLTWCFFVLGLCAKGTAAYLPLLILFINWWQKNKLDWRREIIRLLPFFVAGSLAAILTFWLEQQLRATAGMMAMRSPIEKILIAGRAFWFYLGKLLWPTSLQMFYPRWTIDAGIWWQYLFPATAVALLLGAWWLRRRFRWLWAGLFFFLIMLLPVLGFFNVRFFRFQYVSEHFEYLAMLGVVVPLAADVSTKLNRLRDWRRVAGYCIVGIVLSLLTVQTWRHSAAFRTAEVCYQDSIDKSDGNWTAHLNLAIIMIGSNQPNDAEAHLRKALQLNPPDVASVATIHLDLGQVFRLERRPTEAIDEFRKSIQLWRDFRAYDALADLLRQRGNQLEALDNYRKAMELAPNSPVPMANAAWLLATSLDASLRNGNQALQFSLKANQLSGGADPYSLRALAAAYAETGNFSAATEKAGLALRVSTEQKLTDLAAQIRSDIGSYEANRPIRE